MRKLIKADAGNGNPPPKKPPVENPERQPAPADDIQELDAGNGNPPPKEQAN